MAKVNKKQMIILSVILVCIMIVLSLLMGKFAYSYLGADIDPDAVTEGEVSASGDTLVFTKGNALSLNASTDNFSTGDGNLVATTQPKAKLVASAKTNNASAKYNVGFTINKNTYQYSTTEKTGEVILTIKNPSNTVISSITGLNYVTVNGVSGFDVTGKEGTFIAASDYAISTTSSSSGTTQTWTFTLTFVNFETDQSINEMSELNMDITLQKDPITYTLANYIKARENLDETLYKHDNTLTNGAEDLAYRYSGANYALTEKSSAYNNVHDTSSSAKGLIKMYCSRGASYSYVDNTNCTSSYTKYYYLAYDTNKTQYSRLDEAESKAIEDGYLKNNVSNYVCFGSDAETCPIDNLYRIIGVFGDKVKLIKYDYANSNMLGTNGEYNTSTYSKNSYLNYKGSLETINRYYYAYKGGISNNWENSLLNKTNLNINYINYLNNQNEKWMPMIEDMKWNIGGYRINATTAKVSYNAEITMQTTEISKIGLMYASDYGYSANPSNWKKQLALYNTIIRSDNWIYMGISEWTITPTSGSTDSAFNVSESGAVYSGDRVSNAFGIRPVFYLKTDTPYVSGEGTSSSPYRIAQQ